MYTGVKNVTLHVACGWHARSGYQETGVVVKSTSHACRECNTVQIKGRHMDGYSDDLRSMVISLKPPRNPN